MPTEKQNLATCSDEEFEKWLEEQAKSMLPLDPSAFDIEEEEAFEAWLKHQPEGVTKNKPSLSEIEGDEVDPWDY